MLKEMGSDSTHEKQLRVPAHPYALEYIIIQ